MLEALIKLLINSEIALNKYDKIDNDPLGILSEFFFS